MNINQNPCPLMVSEVGEGVFVSFTAGRARYVNGAARTVEGNVLLWLDGSPHPSMFLPDTIVLGVHPG